MKYKSSRTAHKNSSLLPSTSSSNTNVPSGKRTVSTLTTINKHHFIFDKSLLILITSLLVSGLIVIYSSTVIHSQALFKDPYRFVLLQLGWILISFVGFIFFIFFDYSKLNTLAYLFMGASILFLSFLAFSGILPCKWSIPFFPCINEANRWIVFNPPPFPKIPLIGEVGFQPSEFAKLSLILYLSFKLPTILKKNMDAFFVYLISTGLIAGLIMLQPNMSTAVMVFFIGSIIYFASGAPVKSLFLLLPVLILAGILFIFTSPYRRERLLTFTHRDKNQEELSSGYHIKQVSIALGSGGLFGVGFGQSKQKYYLPEVSSDSIFAIIGEEFGFIGSLVVIIAFMLFVYKGITLARNLEDPSYKLLVVGITAWLSLQFIVHVYANTALIPYTGVPIPLISYGGSSMLFSMMGLGILVGLSRDR
jgi:cell division protein FtsW